MLSSRLFGLYDPETDLRFPLAKSSITIKHQVVYPLRETLVTIANSPFWYWRSFVEGFESAMHPLLPG